MDHHVYRIWPEKIAKAMIEIGEERMAEQAEVVALRDIHGLSFEEIGSRIGRSGTGAAELFARAA